jgi:hypothetical protein
MSTAAMFLDIEKAFDSTWHSGLLYNLSKAHTGSQFAYGFQTPYIYIIIKQNYAGNKQK